MKKNKYMITFEYKVKPCIFYLGFYFIFIVKYAIIDTKYTINIKDI